MGEFPYPVVDANRPVDPDWHCHQSGDCCTTINFLVMTPEEKACVEAAAAAQPDAPHLRWRTEPGGMVSLVARPCPLLKRNAAGLAVCSVYRARPYNCRRWGCLRPDPSTEPFEPDSQFLGAANTRDRFYTSRIARRTLTLMQRKAMKWALAHGWKI